MKRLIYLSLLIGIALFTACSSRNRPQPTSSAQVDPSPTSAAASTPTPDSTAAAPRPTGTAAPPSPAPTETVTPQPTLPPTGVFAIKFYPPLVLEYPPEQWLDQSEYHNTQRMVNYLQHKALESCTINPMGPSGFWPEDMVDLRLGSIDYQVQLDQKLTTGEWVSYYFAISAPGIIDDEIGVPVFSVVSAPADAEKCRAAAEAVLATLAPASRQSTGSSVPPQPTALVTSTAASTPITLAEPTLPVKDSVDLPSAVLVHQDEGKRLMLVSAQGELIHTLANPGIEAFHQAHNIHVIGGISGEDQTVPLALITYRNRGEVLILEHLKRSGTIPAGGLTYLESAPGQPVIAYSTSRYQPANDHMLSDLYLRALDDLSAPVEPLLSESLPESRVLFPYAVYARDGKPLGVWLTREVNGIGGVIFPPQRSLFYVDYATGRAVQALPMDLAPRGLSPDYAYAAYSQPGQLAWMRLDGGQTTAVPVLSSSTMEAGYAVFSPGSRRVAWMEAGGDPYAQPPTLQSWLRIAGIDGDILLTQSGQDLAEAAGFTPTWLQPAGWLDEDRLLVQAYDWFETGGRALITVDLATGQSALFAKGEFIDLF